MCDIYSMLKDMPQGSFKQVKLKPRYEPGGRYDGADGRMRVYECDRNMYPSVTAFLGHDQSKKDGLNAWRERIGLDVANHITSTAAENGSNAHELMEFYLSNKIHPGFKKMSLLSRAHFENLKDIVDEHVDVIRGCEVQVYNDELKLAGTVDLIAEFDGVLSIIDFKTNRKSKTMSMLQDYFIQTSVYAHMYGSAYFMDPLLIKQGVVIISKEDDVNAEFHKVDTLGERETWMPRLKQFHLDLHNLIEESANAAIKEKKEVERLWQRRA